MATLKDQALITQLPVSIIVEEGARVDEVDII